MVGPKWAIDDRLIIFAIKHLLLTSDLYNALYLVMHL